MKPKAAVRWLKAILEDTLEPDDERDAERIVAVKLAIESLESHRKKESHPRRVKKQSRPARAPRN